MAGHPVRVNVTRDVLDQLGKNRCGDSDDFVRSVRDEISDSSSGSLCLLADEMRREWRDLSMVPRPMEPPYFGCLCFLVLAAGEGEFDSHAYYPRLRNLLGEQAAEGMYPNMPRTLALWADLQHWANIELNGARGQFRAVKRGDFPYVSLPKAQVLLTERDRELLHVMFKIARIDPERRPSRAMLASILVEYGQGILPGSIVRLLGHSDVLRDYLLDDIENEIDRYDPSLVSLASFGRSRDPMGAHRQAAVPPIELTLSIEVGLKARTRLRFFSEEDVLDSDDDVYLRFADRAEKVNVACGGRFPGWSSPLEIHPGNPFDASTIDWTQNFELKPVEDRGPTLRLLGRDLRVFAPSLEAVSGMLEQANLPAFGECLVAASSSANDALIEWLMTATPPIAYKVWPTTEGLPEGWTVVHVPSVPTDGPTRQRFPGEIEEEETLRILVRGGVKVQGYRNRFFCFAPPSVVLAGTLADATVSANGKPLCPGPSGCFALPSAFGEPGICEIVVTRDRSLVARRTLELIDVGDGPNATAVYTKFGRDGERLVERGSFCAGCLVEIKPEDNVPIAKAVASGPPTVTEQEATDAARHLAEAIASRESLWADGFGNEFAILGNLGVLCATSIRNREKLRVAAAAAKLIGYEMREMKFAGRPGYGGQNVG